MRKCWFGLALLLLLLSGQAQAKERLMSRQTTAYFSTASALFVYIQEGEEAAFEQTWTQVKDLLGQIEGAVSVSVPESDIARFNGLSCGEEIAISPLTAQLLRIAFDAYERTDGLYDPTVYPLVDLWGFSPRFNRNEYVPSLPYDRAYVDGSLPLPDERHIQALLPLVGLRGVVLTQRDGQAYLRKETQPVEIDGTLIQAQIDLGGIAKGYACDRVIALLREKGYTQGHFVCGGSSLAVLSRPDGDGAYELTLVKPRTGQSSEPYYATVKARDAGVSTSVDISHGFERDGVIYCHMMNPATGWPINMPDAQGVQSGLAGATLIMESAALCDALTTALLAMGPEAAMDYLSRMDEEADAVLVAFKEGEETLEVLCSADVPGLTLIDPAYVLASYTDANGQVTYKGQLFAPSGSEE